MKPVNVKFVKRIFAGVTKLRVLKWVDYPELSRWALSVFVREREREISQTCAHTHTNTHTREDVVATEQKENLRLE